MTEARQIATVCGAIHPDELGPTLMHEHLLIGYPGWEGDTLSRAPEWEVMARRCISRIRDLQELGLRSLVDPCPNDLGRDAGLMREVASETGFQIICATGLYKEEEGGAYWRFRSQFGDAATEMAKLFTHELEEGIADTGIRAGIIKVGTGHGQITDYERLVLEAAASASLATGAPITTHTDQGRLGDEQQEILSSFGVPPQRIIIGHSCGTTDHDYHLRIVRRGSWLGFDRFGLEQLMPDRERVAALVRLIGSGHLEQLVVSHDSVWCWRGDPFPVEEIRSSLDSFFDPTHFHRNIIPMLKAEGISDRQIETLLVDNPRRFFHG